MSNRAERRRADKAAAKGRIAPPPQAPSYAKLGRVNKSVQPGTGRHSSQPDFSPLKSVAFIDADGVTHHGFKSHWELRNSIGRENPAKALPTDTPGFWTVDDTFVTRAEAAVLCGWTAGREILSSDVW